MSPYFPEKSFYLDMHPKIMEMYLIRMVQNKTPGISHIVIQYVSYSMLFFDVPQNLAISQKPF